MTGRGVRFEYEIGEIVLCFEPDPTKARVLYEAKVLDQRVMKDPSGKKKPSYYVHFQGWNSSWDREVADSFVLRDTSENRDLMKKLSDTAKKYCRKNSQRRNKINTILHQAFGGAPPDFGSISASEDSDEENEHGKRTGKGKSYQDKKKQKTSLIEYEIPDSLKLQIDDDYILINKRNMLTQVPAKPCVVDVLESFMKTFCVNYLCDPSGGREKTRTGSSKHTLKCPPDKCVSLCKEFVDSLRVIFDFTCPMILLYAAEQQQYEAAISDIKPIDHTKKDEDSTSQNAVKKEDKVPASHQSKTKVDKMSKQQDCNLSSVSQSPTSSPPPSPTRRITRLAAMESHSDSTPLTTQTSTSSLGSPRSDLRSPRLSGSSSSVQSHVQRTDKVSELQTEPIIPIARRTRLKSQFDVEIPEKPTVKPEVESDHNSETPTLPQQQEEPTTNGVEAANSGVGSESMTMGSSRGREDAMDRILGWSLLPTDVRLQNPITPSQIYGPVHLIRMFVKLPDLLKKMNMKEVQIQIIIKFVHHCLQYLVDHQSELIHDDTYVMA